MATTPLNTIINATAASGRVDIVPALVRLLDNININDDISRMIIEENNRLNERLREIFEREDGMNRIINISTMSEDEELSNIYDGGMFVQKMRDGVCYDVLSNNDELFLSQARFDCNYYPTQQIFSLTDIPIPWDSNRLDVLYRFQHDGSGDSYMRLEFSLMSGTIQLDLYDSVFMMDCIDQVRSYLYGERLIYTHIHSGFEEYMQAHHNNFMHAMEGNIVYEFKLYNGMRVMFYFDDEKVRDDELLLKLSKYHKLSYKEFHKMVIFSFVRGMVFLPYIIEREKDMYRREAMMKKIKEWISKYDIWSKSTLDCSIGHFIIKRFPGLINASSDCDVLWYESFAAVRVALNNQHKRKVRKNAIVATGQMFGWFKNVGTRVTEVLDAIKVAPELVKVAKSVPMDSITKLADSTHVAISGIDKVNEVVARIVNFIKRIFVMPIFSLVESGMKGVSKCVGKLSGMFQSIKMTLSDALAMDVNSKVLNFFVVFFFLVFISMWITKIGYVTELIRDVVELSSQWLFGRKISVTQSFEGQSFPLYFKGFQGQNLGKIELFGTIISMGIFLATGTKLNAPSFARNCITWGSILESICGYCPNFINACCKTVGLPSLYGEGAAPELIEFINEVISVVSDPHVEDAIHNDQQAADRIKELYGKLRMYRAYMIDPSMAKYFNGHLANIIIKKLEDLFVEAKTASPEVYDRPEPVAVMLPGPPNQGKSLMMELMPMAIYALLHSDPEFKDKEPWKSDWSFLKCYTRDQISEYWDKYTGQAFTHYNDIFQSSQSVDSSKISLELILAIDRASYNLNSAAINDKGLRYFTSKFVFMTANKLNPQDFGINQPEALVRRFHFCMTPTRINNMNMNVMEKGTHWEKMKELDRCWVFKWTNLHSNDDAILRAHADARRGTNINPRQSYRFLELCYLIKDCYVRRAKGLDGVSLKNFGMDQLVKDGKWKTELDCIDESLVQAYDEEDYFACAHVDSYWKVVKAICFMEEISTNDFVRAPSKDRKYLMTVFDKILKDNDLTVDGFMSLDRSFAESMIERAYNEFELQQTASIDEDNDDLRIMRESLITKGELDKLQDVLDDWNHLPEPVSECEDMDNPFYQVEGQMFETVKELLLLPYTMYNDLRMVKEMQETADERIGSFVVDRTIASIDFQHLADLTMQWDCHDDAQKFEMFGDAWDVKSIYKVVSTLLQEPNYSPFLYKYFSTAKVGKVVDKRRLAVLMRYVTAYVKLVLDRVEFCSAKVVKCNTCLPNYRCPYCSCHEKVSYVLNPVVGIWMNKYWSVQTFNELIIPAVILPVQDGICEGNDFGSLMEVIVTRVEISHMDKWDFTFYAGKKITLHCLDNGQKYLSDGINNLPTFNDWLDSIRAKIGKAYNDVVQFNLIGKVNNVINNWITTMSNSGPLGCLALGIMSGLTAMIIMSTIFVILKYMMVGLFILIQKLIGVKNKLFEFCNFKKEDGNFDGQSFTSRYNHVVKQRPQVVYKQVEGNMHTKEDAITRLLSNLYDITFANSRLIDLVCEDGEVLTTHIGMVDSMQGCFVKHAWISAKCVKNIIMYGPDGGDKHKTVYNRQQFTIKEAEEGRDIVFITFKECLPIPARDIKHRLAVHSPTHCENAMRLMKQLNEDKRLEIGYAPGGKAKLVEFPCVTKVLDPYDKVVEVMNRKYYIVEKGGGANGACGFWEVSLDSRDYNTPFIGIHTAQTGGDSVVCPITQSDFDMTFNGQTYDPYENLFKERGNENMSKSMEGVSAFHKPIGVYMSPHTSCLKPSCLSEFLPEEFHKKAPAKLSPFQLAGSIVSPINKFYKKYSMYEGRAMPDCLWRLRYSPELYEGFEAILDNYKHEWLTLEDVLFGNPEKGIESMEAPTASGFGLKHMFPKRGQWFDKETRWIHPYLRELVNRRVRDIKNGVCFSQVVIDCLKDELRDLERVADGKTRVFCVGEFVACIVCKMFFGTYMRETKLHRAEYTCGVGVNPHAYDWTHLGLRIFQFGRDRVFGGDLPTMDISTQRYLAYLAACYLRVRMNLDEAGFKSCIALMYNIVTTVHVTGGWSYFHEKGNSSGNWLTSWFNSFCCHVYIATCYYYLRPATCDKRFVEYVALAVYGDDNLGSVHRDCDFFDNIKLAGALKELFGLDFTDPNKGVITEPWLPENDQVFLARRFVWFEGVFLAPLDFESLDSMLCWERYHADFPKNAITSQNVEVYKQELAHYVYDIELRDAKWKVVSEAMYKANLKDVGQTVDYWMKARREGHYDTWFYKY